MGIRLFSDIGGCLFSLIGRQGARELGGYRKRESQIF